MSESLEYTVRMFDEQSKILKDSFENIPEKIEEIKLDRIIELYYHVINTSSVIKVLKSQIKEDENQEQLEKIKDIENLIEKEFNVQIHQRIYHNISENIKTFVTELHKKKNIQDKTKQDMEDETRMFEKLREMMSTKEFIEQYDTQIGHDQSSS